MTEKFPITERLPLGLLLAANAGALDAYTYVAHGGVFAGLQTGNMILMGVSAGRGDWHDFTAHLIPFLVFAVGTAFIRSLQHALNTPEAKRRRAVIVLLFEAGMAVVTALVAPHVSDTVTSSLVAIIAAAQLQEFRRLRGKPYMSIMMTGNLRTAAEGFFDWLVRHDHSQLIAARDSAGAIIALILGATISGLAAHLFGAVGIIIASPILIVAAIYVGQAKV
ncbi:YoaK family protein [Lacticaseibacillus hulanensis]|uniref:YoaK family protein n=1 Tax=Lacticaseibacillus hulanensis TaxID=2493111 RepID=UPI000FD8EEF4|nr:YoaK family protein [Lacticaseibacillus hulanensis]